MTVRFERTPIRWGLLPLIVLGGAIGALARGLLTLPFDPPDASVSGLVMLLSVNTLGSALLGLVNGAVGDRVRLRAFLGTGMLGGFTSYSALAPLLGVWPLRAAGDSPGAAAFTGLIGLIVVIALPFAAALAGVLLGRRISRERGGRE
ncbi:fluoride efflux transporter FluC [Microbacterium halotolerans]|uniref:fluoride efflux transporter FluC n=1 Tax=Microbacterium halotolerans TaxID=246613 RepID=UPI0013C30F08|nr:CrcB family protein [Microbacterium halotolerans]